ncbi:MAG: SDR family NAD(P)-dependent oxidoreductase [Bdellovibrionota bacterium]|nr:SDR family NAD(P)-dependent oxidoreductase [Bdellovibrionota bacterium]
MSERSALIVGAGDAIGSAILKRFSRAGYNTVGVRRNPEKIANVISELQKEGHKAHAMKCDARKEDEIIGLFSKIEAEMAPLEVVVFNVGANVPMKIAETPTKKFYKIWEMACFGGFLTGREAAKYLVPRKKGTIIFTGATASLRGAAGFGAFASAKSGLRAVAQSLAREIMPQGVHVAHVVIDAAVDTEFVRQILPQMKPNRQTDDIVKPDSIAEFYYQIHLQSPDAWTFESDLRPWCEKW